MSYPNIPNVSPEIDICRDDIINLLLASIAFEELGLAHIINSEAEKIQYVLGTLHDHQTETTPTIEDLLQVNSSVNQTLKDIIKTQMLLQFKLEDIINIPTTSTTTTSTTTTSTTTTTTTTTSEYIEAGSAWSVGTDFGTGNAQYTTLEPDEDEKTVTLGLGSNYIPIGTVEIIRVDDTLEVTITTDSPYVMDEVQLYVSNVIPVQSNPGGFPYQYTVSDPIDYFTSHTFIVDISAFDGETLYIAAHAHVLEPV